MRLRREHRPTDGYERAMIWVSAFGVLVGALIGSFSDPAETALWPELLRPSPSPLPAAALLIPALFMLLSASSFLGSALSALCVFAVTARLSSSVAAMYLLGGFGAYREAAVCFGLPALIVFPCFFAFSADCCRRATRLLRLRLSLPGAVPDRTAAVPLLCGAIAVLFYAGYTAYLLPLLI